MPRLLLLVLAAALLTGRFTSVQAATFITGRISKVTDGDTLVINGLNIRLHGIDAPELRQTCQSASGASYACGQLAKSNLAGKIGGATVKCEQKDKDRYGRVVAVCRMGATFSLDLNKHMVASGLALAYREYSTDYVSAEKDARVNKRGLWEGSFQMPWECRNGASPPPPPPKTRRPPPPPLKSRKPPPSRPPPPPPSPRGGGWGQGCLIKGNISSNGNKIYHTPSSPWYAQTEVDAARGERWFCSEAEALAAGWRAPGR